MCTDLKNIEARESSSPKNAIALSPSLPGEIPFAISRKKLLLSFGGLREKRAQKGNTEAHASSKLIFFRQITTGKNLVDNIIFFSRFQGFHDDFFLKLAENRREKPNSFMINWLCDLCMYVVSCFAFHIFTWSGL